MNLYRRKQETPGEIQAGEIVSWRERLEKLENLRACVRENIEDAREKQARYYNSRRRDRTYAIEDCVMKRLHMLSSTAKHVAAKLSPNFYGPFVIEKILSPTVFELVDETGKSLGKVYAKDLKPYVE